MDSQIPRQQGLDSNEVMEGEEGQGKTSMFKKAKAKARKIKDTLKTKTGRDQDRDSNQNDQTPDEDEDEEAHDAVPMHESPEVMNTVTGQKPADKLENPTPAGVGAAEDRYDSKRAPKSYTGSHDQFSPEPIPPPSTDSVTKLPSSPSSYTEKISYATSAISVKAIAAKNVVASKLGYGGSTENPTAASRETNQGGEEIGKPATGYGQKIVAAVTPVYEKASNVGSSVVSKVRGTGPTEQERGGVKGQEDQRGVKAKEYLAEKLRPSEDDKALSEVISDSLRSRKGEVEGAGGEEGQNENKPVVGIVTESEEVRERLGSDQDSNREMTETEAQAAATGKGYVESLQGTVASWFSKGGDQKRTSDEASPPGGAVPGEERFSDSTDKEAVGHVRNGVEERRLQESGN